MTAMMDQILNRTKAFYNEHKEIKESHGIRHVTAVYEHAVKAVAAQKIPLRNTQIDQVLVASLLHDVDDHKYFPAHKNYENAVRIMTDVGLDLDTQASVLEMISWVSCSKNGNSVPEKVKQSEEYWRLIPRWSDRLEAVGASGVVRCFQYNTEHGLPLCSKASPRPQTEADVWEFASTERFEQYKGDSADMISHYYDKLLRVSCPPKEIVRNPYLEMAARDSAKELIEVCLRYGMTGSVDAEYISSLIETKLK